MPYSAEVEDFENVQEVWEAILPQSNTNTIFVTPWWQQSWWRVFGEGSNPHTVVVRDGDDVAGIAPLMLNDRTLSFAGAEDLRSALGSDRVGATVSIRLLRGGEPLELSATLGERE